MASCRSPTRMLTAIASAASPGSIWSYQPEWHRNVPIEFEAEAAAEDDGDDDKVIMPDLAEVTLVTVAGSDVTLIDACLGKGPGAGLDVPCSDAAEGFGTPAPPSEPAGATEGAGTSRCRPPHRGRSRSPV